MTVRRIHPYAAVALLALVTLVLFWPVLSFDFINLDDPYLVQNNGDFLKPLTWESLTKPVAGLYHPLTNLSYWVDAQIAGAMEPGAFHRTNLIFHLLALLGIFLWIMRLTGRPLAATLLAAAFAWHPTHVESVAWISERKDVVSVAFYFLALAAHAESLRARRAALWLAVALVMAFLSLLGKPFAITLPVVLLWVEVARGGASRQWLRSLAKRAWFWLPLVALALAGALLVLKSQNDVRARESIDWLEASLRIPQQLWFYLGKTFWPDKLKLLYTGDDLIPDWPESVAGALFLIGTCLMAYRSKEFRRDTVFGAGFFLLTLAPMLKLVPFGDNTPVSDRYLYVSQTGLLWPWAMALRPRMWFLAGAWIAILISWLVLTDMRLPDWKDAPSMWESMLAIDPDSRDAHENLGRYYLGKEKPALSLEHLRRGQTGVWDNAHNQAFVLMRLGRLEEAEAQMARVEKLVPNDPKVLNLRGNLLMELNRLDEAEAFFRRAVAAPTALLQDLVKAEAQTNIGVVAFRRQNYQDCVAWQDIALRSLPGYTYALHNRGVCNYLMKNLEGAKRDYEATIAIDPAFAMAHNGLGAIALQQRKLEEAELHFRNALKADPNLAVARENLNRVLQLKGR